MCPYRPGMGVLVVVSAFLVSQPACLAQQVRDIPQGRVFSVAFSPDGKTVAAGWRMAGLSCGKSPRTNGGPRSGDTPKR